ncbi:MAG: hypothetical protein Q9226_005072 [Calogaya cf. arnoldii]
MGCCTSNPCAQNGCPAKDLRAAILSTNEAEAGPYSAIDDPAATKTPTSSSPSSTSSATQSGSDSATSDLSQSATSPINNSLGALVGGVVGGVAVIALLAILAFFLLRRRRQRHSSTAIELPGHDKESPPSSYQDSSTFPTPFHELETPPPNPWHTATGNVHEMPSPEIGGRQARVKDEKQLVEQSNEGLGIYTPYKPAGKIGTGRPGLYDEGRNISYELDGRGI